MVMFKEIIQQPKFLLVLVFALLALVLSAFGVFSLALGFVLGGLLLGYIFFGKYDWLILSLGPLGLIFGSFFSFEPRPNWVYEASISEAIILFLAGLLLIRIIFEFPKFRPRVGSVGLWMLLYLAIGLASFFYIKNFELYVAGIKIFLLSFLAYLLAFNFLNSFNKIRVFMVSLSLTVTLLSLELLHNLYLVGFSVALFADRTYLGVTMGPLALVAALLSLLTPIMLGYYFELKSDDKLRILLLISFVLGFTAVCATLSKAAIGSLALAMLFLFIKLKEKRLAMVLFLISFALLGYTFLSPYAEGLFDRFSIVVEDPNTRFRFEEYSQASKIIRDHPWLGVGAGQQLMYYQRLISPDYREWVNNYLLQALVDYGVIGLSVYLALITSIIVMSVKMIKKHQRPLAWALVAGFIAAFFNGLVEVTLLTAPYAVIFWLLVGTAAAVLKIKKSV